MLKTYLFIITASLLIYACSLSGNKTENFKLLQTEVDTLLEFNANPSSGFHYPYFIFIPKGTNMSNPIPLIVETNNSGSHDSLEYHINQTRIDAKEESLGTSISKALKLPFLMPVFPRTWDTMYTHALDRYTMLEKSGNLNRLDLQLIAMINHASDNLSKMNISTTEKFIMNGFSASGTFANRFTLLHPDKVEMAVYGGINSMLIFPMEEIEEAKLIYPLGISDFKEITDSVFNRSIYLKVPQYIYMGEVDSNDAVPFKDAYSDYDRDIIYEYIGKNMHPERWKKCQEIYSDLGVNATFRTYSNLGHGTNREVYLDIIEYIETTMNKHTPTKNKTH